MKEAAYVVNRHQSRIYGWIDKGILTWRRSVDGRLEVATVDVLKVESVTRLGRPKRKTRVEDTPHA